jgi:hypothetical protein
MKPITARVKRASSPGGRQDACPTHGTCDASLPLDAALPRAVRTRYVNNLAALYRTDSALAQRIEALPFADLPALEPTRDGRLTARVAADDGKLLYLHSRYRPVEEARTFVEELRDVEQATFLITGMGLGYHLLEFARVFDNPLLIVAEDDLRVIKLALCCCDLADLFRGDRLVVLTSADTGAIHERLTPRNADIMMGAKFAALPHTRRIHAEFHARIAEALADFVSFCRMQLVTLLKNARITCRNIANNLAAYTDNAGIEVLEGRAKGYPAILVAAGPSLARNIDQLNALRERAVIICVQTVFKSLLARDCPPHFVTSLDFHEISSQFFDGVDAAPHTALVAEPKATWHVLDRFPGRKHVLQNRFADALLRSAAPRRGALKAGATVAHLSFYLAEHLGCDPIILVGQDLAYSEAMYYPPGLPIERVWGPELNRFCTIETKQQERICRAKPILRKVKDVHGRDAWTDDQLFTYARQFEADFSGSAARVVHACEGGMHLSGVETMTLRDAARRFCTRPLPPVLFDASPDRARIVEPSRVREELAQRLEEVRAIRDIGEKMTSLLAKLESLVERPADFNRLVGRVDELRTRLHQYDRSYALVIDVSQHAELRRLTADRGIKDVQRENAESARRRLRRDREFVVAFLDGCAFLEKMLPEAIERLPGGAA